MAPHHRVAPKTETKEIENNKMMDLRIKYYSQRYRILMDSVGDNHKTDLELGVQKRILDKFKQDRVKLINKTFVTDRARSKEIEFLEDFVDSVREKAFSDHRENIRGEIEELDKGNIVLKKEIERRTAEYNNKKAAITGLAVSSEPKLG